MRPRFEQTEFLLKVHITIRCECIVCCVQLRIRSPPQLWLQELRAQQGPWTKLYKRYMYEINHETAVCTAAGARRGCMGCNTTRLAAALIRMCIKEDWPVIAATGDGDRRKMMCVLRCIRFCALFMFGMTSSCTVAPPLRSSFSEQDHPCESSEATLARAP